MVFALVAMCMFNKGYNVFLLLLFAVVFVLFARFYVVEIFVVVVAPVGFIMITHAIKRKISQIMVFINFFVVWAAKKQHVDSSNPSYLL